MVNHNARSVTISLTRPSIVYVTLASRDVRPTRDGLLEMLASESMQVSAAGR
jgi:hypothetical protein